MPKRKGWKKSKSKRTDWRTGKYESSTSPISEWAQSPERRPALSPISEWAQSPERRPAFSPISEWAQSPEWKPALRPEKMQALSPEKMPVFIHEKKQAYNQKQSVYNTELEGENIQNKQTEFQHNDLLEDALLTSLDSEQKRANKDNQANTNEFQQLVIDLSKLIENVKSNVQTDFDAVFLDTFPGVDADYQSRNIENLSERQDITVCSQKTMFQQHAWHKKDITAQPHVNRDSSEPGLDNDVVCYQAVKSSVQLWNACDLVFGSFHQNDVRFSEQSRGYQCTCNALCMLSYSSCLDTEKSSILDKVLCEGDVLYQSVIKKLREDGKFVNHLLTLEEIPDDFKVEIGKFTSEKLPIVSGVLLDTQNLGLPTLHEVLQSVFLYATSGLLTIGAICSAVFRKNDMYVFFDSHSHGENGLSSNDGTSCLITFTSINDLVTYMYAFYDSLNLDTNTNLQFDFLPIKIKMTEETRSFKDQMDRNMEAYFNDQRLRQAHKAQLKRSRISSISIEESKAALGKKRKKNRMEYYKLYRRKCRQITAFKAKEKQSKQTARANPVFKAKETVYQLESKQSARKDPVFRTKEKNQSNIGEPILFLRPKNLCTSWNQSNQQERTLSSEQKKKYQSNIGEPILFLRPKKLCTSWNRSNQLEKTLVSKQKKE